MDNGALNVAVARCVMHGALLDYAGDIAAAWAVLDELYAHGWIVGVKHGPCGQWKAKASRRDPHAQLEAIAPTAPRAIGELALTVVAWGRRARRPPGGVSDAPLSA
jgi:hypothetical protein